MTKRQQLIYIANGQCFYCGCLVNEQTRYQPDSFCLNLYVARKHGGSKQGHNQVVACYSCCYIKRDLDTRKLSVEQVRQQLNEERRRLGLAYNKLYCKNEQEVPATEGCLQVIEALPQPRPGPELSVNEEEQEDEQHQEWLKQALSQLQLDQGQNI